MPDEQAESVKLTIDGKEVVARAGATVLEVVRQEGIDIPALCCHPVLGGAGACKLCVVEIVAEDQRRVRISCTYRAREGLQVFTDSEEVIKARQAAISELLARAPAAKVVQELAKEYGVSEPAYESTNSEARCILCGQCVRTCKKLIKVSAIGFAGRGKERKVGTPDDGESTSCLACGACFNLCPTGNIRMRDTAKSRDMLTWHTQVDWSRCSECGRTYSLSSRLVKHLKEKTPASAELLEVCPPCRRSNTARSLAEAAGLVGEDEGYKNEVFLKHKDESSNEQMI